MAENDKKAVLSERRYEGYVKVKRCWRNQKVLWGSWNRTRPSEFTFTFHFHALEKEMATHSSVLAWRIPGMGEPCGLLSMGSHRVRHDRSDLTAAAAQHWVPKKKYQEVRVKWKDTRQTLFGLPYSEKSCLLSQSSAPHLIQKYVILLGVVNYDILPVSQSHCYRQNREVALARLTGILLQDFIFQLKQSAATSLSFLQFVEQ